MKLFTLVPHLLYLKNYVLFKFQHRNIAATQIEKQIWSTYPIFPFSEPFLLSPYYLNILFSVLTRALSGFLMHYLRFSCIEVLIVRTPVHNLKSTRLISSKYVTTSLIIFSDVLVFLVTVINYYFT